MVMTTAPQQPKQGQKKVFVPDLEKLAKHKERELAHYRALGIPHNETFIEWLYKEKMAQLFEEKENG
jgi:hypothetical protein